MIRLFQPCDLEPVMILWLNSNLKAHDFIDPNYWISHLEAVKQLLPQSHLLVYESAGEILGFVGWKEQYIAGIFVDEKSRSNGIGTALLNKLKAENDALFLHVYEKNTRAVRFYLREGFLIAKKQTDEATGETEFQMEWTSPGKKALRNEPGDCR